MGIRANVYRALQREKASIIGLPAGQQPDRPLEKTWDDTTLLSTYGDDPWPYICASRIASQASMPKLKIGREDANGDFVAVKPTHAVQQLLDNPNPLNTGSEFRELLLIYMELTGHAPIEIVRPSRGARLHGALRTGFELYVHNPGPWRIVANRDASIKGYLYLLANTPYAGYMPDMLGAQDVMWTPDDMTYLRWPNPLNRWYGQGRLAAVRQSVMAEEYAAIRDKRFEQQNGVPPGLLSSKMPLGEPQAAELQRRWEKGVGGYQNAGRIAVLGSDMMYQAIESHRDATINDQRHWRVQEIAAAFEMPLVLVLMSEATFANAKEGRAEWWEGSLLPKLGRIEEMVTERLLPLLTDEPLIARFDYTNVAALNENQDEVAGIAVKMVQTASFTKNEIRKRMGEQPFPAGDPRGDELAMPTTFRDTLAAASFDAADPNASENINQAATAAPGQAPSKTPPPAKALKRAEPHKREEALAPTRAAYAADLSSFFRQQGSALVGRSPADKSDTWRRLTKALPEDEGQNLIDRAIAIINAIRFRTRLQDISERPIKAAFGLGVEDAAKTLGVRASFAIGANQESLDAVNARLVSLANALQSTTTADVTRVISDGLAAGDDIETIRSDLGSLFDSYQDWRLDRISRTETTNAYNIGSVGQYRDAGVSQVYVTDGDGDDECAEADGSTWSLEEAESDPSAHPNCTRSFDPIPADEAPTPVDTLDPEEDI